MNNGGNMTTKKAIELGIIIKENDGELIYNGMCNDCRYSKRSTYSASSNICKNQKSEWYGVAHIDLNLRRFVNGCSCFEKIKPKK